MRRLAIVAATCLVVLAVASQFVLPPLAERAARDRLTRDGGSADVEISAFPAVRLLFHGGDRLRVRARGVELPLLDPNAMQLDDLDGFDEVDVHVSDARSGPFRLADVVLTRPEDARAYRTSISGSVNGRDLGTFAGSRMGGPLGGFLGGLAGGALPFGDEQIPLDLDAVIRSDDGRPRAVTVHGEVAGLPAGPLVEALAQALAGSF